MFMGLMDYKNSLSKKMMNQDNADPGGLSFMEPGWWAFHAVAITGIYMIGQHVAKNNCKH